MKTLLTGYSSIIGRHVFAELLACGHLPVTLTSEEADLTTDEGMAIARGYARDCEALVHVAGLFEPEPEGRRVMQVNYYAFCELAVCLRQFDPVAIGFLDADPPIQAKYARYVQSKDLLHTRIVTPPPSWTNIRTNAVALGHITKHHRQSHAHFARMQKKSRHTPPTPQTVARVAVALMNPGITQQVVALTGGL